MKGNLINKKGTVSFLSSLLAIIAGLLVGLVILFITEPSQALAGFGTILAGGFMDGAKGVGETLYFATPIIMTGLSVGFAYRAGLFNIGASGQFMVGAYVAILVGVKCTFLPPALHWVAAVLLAALAGGVWGAVPGC